MMKAEYQRNNKYKQKQMGNDFKRLKVLESCEVLVCSVFEFGMDLINNLKLKDIRVLLHYHFG